MPDTPPITASRWRDLLVQLGVHVRDQVTIARRSGEDLARPVAQEGGDTIFAIDRHVEPAMLDVIGGWPAECFPLLLVAEGMGADGRVGFASPGEQVAADAVDARWVVIIDPIDGTRNLMYDKRAAWFLAAAAPITPDQPTPGVADAIASALVELPVSKAGFADTFGHAAGEPLQAMRHPLLSPGEPTDLPVAASTATTLDQGFAQVSNFFPGTKTLAAELMERIVRETLGEVEVGGAAVFDDQYISTGGQFVELMCGRDRFCCDLRPLLYRALGVADDQAGLACHPYDVAGMTAVQSAGVALTDGLGGPLNPPMDVHHPVHWCGYANESLRRQIEPVILNFFDQYGVAR
jgi:hypothetical protein